MLHGHQHIHLDSSLSVASSPPSDNRGLRLFPGGSGASPVATLWLREIHDSPASCSCIASLPGHGVLPPEHPLLCQQSSHSQHSENVLELPAYLTTSPLTPHLPVFSSVSSSVGSVCLFSPQHHKLGMKAHIPKPCPCGLEAAGSEVRGHS